MRRLKISKNNREMEVAQLFNSRKSLRIFLYLLPALAFMSVFLFYPFIMSIVKSFYQSDGFVNSTFIGLDNYRRLFEDKTIRIAIGNTFKLMLYVVIFQVGIAVLLAVMVDSVTKGQKLFRTVYFFPIVISATAIGMMFKLFYAYDGGLFNAIIATVGADPKVWITRENAMKMVSIPAIWQYVGFYFVIILTAIKQVPKDLYESAYLEGIKPWSKLFYITVPLIRNVMITCLILAITGTLKVFDMALIITGGGPLNASQVLGLYMYQKTFTDEVFGYGATISVLIVFIGLTLSLIVNKVFKKDDLMY